jgi:hypothetical protein
MHDLCRIIIWNEFFLLKNTVLASFKGGFNYDR